MNASVSIIIPIYNGEEYLHRCLNSMQVQTYANIEVILVDDGSTDGSQALCSEFCSKDKRFNLICPEHGGVSHARNVGIANASGDYLMFVDGDDEVLPDMVERYLKAACDTQADVVIGGIDFIKCEERTSVVPTYGRLNRKDIAEKICQDTGGLFGYVPNKMYRLSLLKNNEILFDENMFCQEDLDFALRFYSVANTFALIDYSGYIYYQANGKRDIPQNDLMKNRISIYQLACNSGASKEIIELYVSVIKNSLAKVLIYAKDCKVIENLSEVSGLMEVISIPTKEKLLTNKLVALFTDRRFSRILLISNIRRKLRNIINR